ncbi:MAG: hypothetical protein H7061_11360 [Bdellovibrionaceae bacterium]|nr:hypothetical protein [Bdellovibrio sp.]
MENKNNTTWISKNRTLVKSTVLVIGLITMVFTFQNCAKGFVSNLNNSAAEGKIYSTSTFASQGYGTKAAASFGPGSDQQAPEVYEWMSMACLINGCFAVPLTTYTKTNPPLACSAANAEQVIVKDGSKGVCLSSRGSSLTLNELLKREPSRTFGTPYVPPIIRGIEFKVNGAVSNGIVKQGDTIVGRVFGYAENDSFGCVEVLRDGMDHGMTCDTQGYTKLPNEDWSYDRNSKEWKATFDTGRFPKAVYIMRIRDTAYNAQHYRLELR